MFTQNKFQKLEPYRLDSIHIYTIKQDIRIYVPYSRPNGWTDWAEIFCDINLACFTVQSLLHRLKILLYIISD